ncbi:MAG TPA: type II toxin-antitoxin system VapC family toxin [Cyclobacteriaceae bacterium]
MTFILDTHIILWWLEDSHELRHETKSLIMNPENRIWISTASIWEINIKMGIGKLKISNEYANILIDDGFEILDIQLPHVMKVLELPDIHGDPFDRILIAQTMIEEATLVTRDKNITQYPIGFMLA